MTEPDSNPNPYAPPVAPVQDSAAQRGSPVKAVLLGVLTDIGGSLLVSTVIVFAYAMLLGASGADQTQIDGAMEQMTDFGSTPFLILSSLGYLCSVLGGYVCARIARHAEYKLAAFMLIISVPIGLLLGGAAYTIGQNVVLAVLGIGAVLLGAHLGHKRNAID